MVFPLKFVKNYWHCICENEFKAKFGEIKLVVTNFLGFFKILGKGGETMK